MQFGMSSINMYETDCNTKIDWKKCSFTWTIENYLSFHCEQRLPHGEFSLRSSSFSAVNDDFKWHLRHTLRYGEHSKVADLCLVPDCFADVKKYAPIFGEVKFSITRFENDGKGVEKEKFYIKVDDTSFDVCFREFIWVDFLQYGDNYFDFDEELLIFCELTYVKSNDIINVPTSSPNLCEITESALARDFEQLYGDKRFSDLTIFLKDEKYLAHKNVLAARSSVFSAMLQNNTLENTTNSIKITDISAEIFENVLLYIYTGKVKNLNESAFELFAASDKYDLKELRVLCEKELCQSLSIENAVEILTLAVMHQADSLKMEALKFIKTHTHKTNWMDKAVWNDLCNSYPSLMKDILSIFM